jgi:hypothetical protein
MQHSTENGPVDRSIAALAEAQHGVVARRQLLGMGIDLSAGDLEGRLTRGALLALHRGVYAVGHARVTQEGRWMAAVLACGPGAALSHRSAGQLWGLVARHGSVPEVTRARGFRGRPGIRAHRSKLPPDELEVVDGIPVTSVSRTLLDLSAVLSPSQLDGALNEAEVRRLTSVLSLPDLLRRYPGRRGAAGLRAALEDGAAGVTRSELERRFAALLATSGLPAPRRNGRIAVRGRFYELDCVWERERAIVELDGRAVHGTHRAFEADRERDRILLAEGWRPMRVTWRQLRDEPEAIIGDLKRLLGNTSYP